MSSFTTSNKRKVSKALMVTAEYAPGLRGLGDLLTSSLIVNPILAFADFDSLLSLRLVNHGLCRVITEKELFYRSLRVLPTYTDVRSQDLMHTFRIRQGWSSIHMKRSSVVQAALEKANSYGNETRAIAFNHGDVLRGTIAYNHGDALRRLQAGQAVSANHFPFLEDEVDQVEVGGYDLWTVQAPEFHTAIKASRAWKVFLQLHQFPLSSKDESLAFSQVLFGLLVNARTLRRNRIMSTWKGFGRRGRETKCNLLIELKKGQKFEVEMTHSMDWEAYF